MHRPSNVDRHHLANDSISEDSVQEYAVLRPQEDGSYNQVEAITVSWCERPKLLRLLVAADRGEYDRLDHVFAWVAGTQVQERGDHAPCPLCA